MDFHGPIISLSVQVYVEAALHAGNTVVRRQNSKHFTRQHDPKIALLSVVNQWFFR